MEGLWLYHSAFLALEIYLSRAQLMVFNCTEFLTLGATLAPAMCSIVCGPMGILSTRPVSSRSTTKATLAMVIAAVWSRLPSKNANVLCRQRQDLNVVFLASQVRQLEESTWNFRRLAYVGSQGPESMALSWRMPPRSVPRRPNQREMSPWTRKWIYRDYSIR